MGPRRPQDFGEGVARIANIYEIRDGDLGPREARAMAVFFLLWAPRYWVPTYEVAKAVGELKGWGVDF